MRFTRHVPAGWFLLAWIMIGCSVTSTVPEHDFLYKGATLIAKDSLDPAVLRAGERKLTSRGNTRFLGIPYRLIIYNIFYGKKTDGSAKRMLKIAEPPVLISQIDTVELLSRLKQHLFASGYFKSEVTATAKKDAKTAIIDYYVRAGKRSKIGKVIYPKDSVGSANVLKLTSDSSLLRPGDYIQLDILSKERDRINENLKDRGYFLFNSENIGFQADTIGKEKEDLYVFLKPGATEKSLSLWTLGKIFVHNSDLSNQDSLGRRKEIVKRLNVQGKHEQVAGYNMRVYRDALLLKNGEIYSKKKHFLSIQRMLNLQTFQLVKFTFIQHPTDSVNLLTTHLYVTPLKKYHVKFEASAGAKGNNYLGTKLTSSLINSNLFGGAEKLTLELEGGADLQFGGGKLGINSINFGGQLSLALPRLIPGFRISGGLNSTLPETRISLGSVYYHIPKLFSINLAGLTLDYKFRSNRTVEHSLTPFDVGVFRLNKSTAIFDTVLVHVPSLQQTFRSQIYTATSYGIWIDKPALPGSILKGGMGFKVKSSGNLLGILVPRNRDNNNERSIFGLPISQFLKLEGEVRGYIKIGSSNVMAVRTSVGVGIAYGNLQTLPYSEQFFIGGSNSLRAFRAGTVGPGSFRSTNKVLSSIEYGDFKLEMNGEWRHSFNSLIKLAAFIDAGNIWLRKDDPTKPGASLHNAFSELAVGGGAGLRFDFSLFILRFDLAFPFRKPWYPEGHRWVFNEFKPFVRDWRKENLILSIGVGYPF